MAGTSAGKLLFSNNIFFYNYSSSRKHTNIDVLYMCSKWFFSLKFLVGPSPPNAFSVPDCRSMVKTLVCGVKTITWGAGSRKVMGGKIFHLV